MFAGEVEKRNLKDVVANFVEELVLGRGARVAIRQLEAE